MKKFELVSKYIQDFKNEKVEDLMYEIKDNEKLLKEIIYNKISHAYDPLHLNPDLVKQLNIYVTNGFEFTTEIWLDIDEDNDLFFIYKDKILKIDDVDKIKEIFIDWLLG